MKTVTSMPSRKQLRNEASGIDACAALNEWRVFISEERDSGHLRSLLIRGMDAPAGTAPVGWDSQVA